MNSARRVNFPLAYGVPVFSISTKIWPWSDRKIHRSGHDHLPELQVGLVGDDIDVVEGLVHELAQLLLESAVGP